ncbi:MAG: response regulator [Myxococcales bacterium]|nr:response regulator [Myxococcota bacterium]MDW8280531.1 response regulator [Myxococcales bacterium]
MLPPNLRAVVADDSAVSRYHVGQILGGLGIEIAAYARDGVEAVQQCLKLRPDLLVSDLVMPKLMGIDVVRLVRTRMDIKIVIITSHCDQTMHNRCMAMGASQVLIKPVAESDLKKTLTSLWGSP